MRACAFLEGCVYTLTTHTYLRVFSFAVCTGRCIDASLNNLAPQLLAWLRSFFWRGKGYYPLCQSVLLELGGESPIVV